MLGRQLEVAVEIGNRSGGSAFHHNIGTYNRFTRCVFHYSFDSNLLSKCVNGQEYSSYKHKQDLEHKVSFFHVFVFKVNCNFSYHSLLKIPIENLLFVIVLSARKHSLFYQNVYSLSLLFLFLIIIFSNL